MMFQLDNLIVRGLYLVGFRPELRFCTLQALRKVVPRGFQVFNLFVCKPAFLDRSLLRFLDLLLQRGSA